MNFISIISRISTSFILLFAFQSGLYSQNWIDVKIVRMISSPESCTIGELYVNNNFTCYSLERPWVWNLPYVSCIPNGLYPGTLTFEKQDGWKIRINNVEGRNGILMHIGNWELNTSGCILLGLDYYRNESNSTGMICLLKNSYNAVEAFKKAIYGSNLDYSTNQNIKVDFILTIVDNIEFKKAIYRYTEGCKNTIGSTGQAVICPYCGMDNGCKTLNNCSGKYFVCEKCNNKVNF
jgi:hypothetical protein